jgi:hypothetical protein
MQRFSKVLLGSAAAVALVSSAIAFSTSQASAQISINLGGLGGLIPHGSYGSRYHSRHGRTQHEARHERRSKDKEAKDDDSDNDNSADNGNHGKPDHVQLSGHGPDATVSDPPSPNAPAPSAPPAPPTPPAPAASAQSSGDVPSFTPEK